MQADDAVRLVAMQIDLRAGGAVGPSAQRLSTELRNDGAITMLACESGLDTWMTVAPIALDPSISELLIHLYDLTVGGDLNLYLGAAMYYVPSTGYWEARDARTVLSGPAQAGGDFNLNQSSTRLLDVYQPISAGGDVDLGSGGSLYVWQDITASGTVDIAAAGAIIGSPYERITAHDVSMFSDTTIGGVGDATVNVDLTGGLLDATAFVDIGIREVSGPLRVGQVRCLSGGLRLDAGDTGGSDDGIILGPGALVQAFSAAFLTAGDYVTVDPAALVRADRVTINIDTAAVDPGPGVGAQFSFLGDCYVQSTPVDLQVLINTGVDDDELAVLTIGLDSILEIEAGAGDDLLFIGQSGQIGGLLGQLRFDGGDGADHVVVDGTARTADQVITLNTNTVMPATGFSLPAILSYELPCGIWYQRVEDIDIDLGAGDDRVFVDSTGADVQNIAIRGHDGSDTFTFGEGAGFLLSQINGRLTIDGGANGVASDVLEIVENNFTVGQSFPDDLLTPTSFVGQGMDGVDFSDIEYLDFAFGAHDDHLTITGLDMPAEIDMGTGENQVTLGGPAVPLSDAFTSTLSLSAPGVHDILEVVNSADTDADSGLLTDTVLAGFGLPWGGDLDGFDAVIIQAGSGDSEIEIDTTRVLEVGLFGGAGDDTFTVTSLDSASRVTAWGAEGDDRLDITCTDADLVNGYVFFRGEAGRDTVHLDGSARTGDWLCAVEAAPAVLFGVQAGDARVQGFAMDNGALNSAIFAGYSPADELLFQINHFSMNDIKVWLGEGKDRLEVGPLSSYAQPVTIDLGEGDDEIWLGHDRGTGTNLLSIIACGLSLGGGLGNRPDRPARRRLLRSEERHAVRRGRHGPHVDVAGAAGLRGPGDLPKRGREQRGRDYADADGDGPRRPGRRDLSYAACGGGRSCHDLRRRRARPAVGRRGAERDLRGTGDVLRRPRRRHRLRVRHGEHGLPDPLRRGRRTACWSTMGTGHIPTRPIRVMSGSTFSLTWRATTSWRRTWRSW